MSHVPHIAHRTSTPDDDFVAWPMVDTLYDYTKVLSDDRPIAEVPAELRGRRVAIVGAGAAGISAAYELFRAGLDPDVYEATDRIGGRTDSRLFEGAGRSGPIAELGAMRVPTSCKVFYHYAGLLDMQTTTFPDPGKVLTRLYYENTVYDWPAGQKDGPGIFAGIGRDFQQFIGTITKPVSDAWRRGDLDGVHDAWQDLVDRYADTSFIHAITEGIPTWGPAQRKAFGALGMGSGGFGPLYPVGFLEMLRVLVNQWEQNQQLMTDGINGLVDGLHARTVARPDGSRASLASADCVRLSTPVTGITRKGRTLTLALGGSGGGRSAEYDAVIVACTSHAMAFMGLTLASAATEDAIDPDARSAVRNLPLVNSSKLFIRTKSKFWLEDDTIPQNIQTDEMPRGVYCLNYPHKGPDQGADKSGKPDPQKALREGNGVVLVSYTWRDDSTRLTAASPEQRFEMFTQVLKKIDPHFAGQLVPEADELVVVDWQSQQYYYGGFKLDQPGQETFVQDVYYQFLSALDASRDTGVYLAGDSVSFAGGWTEGALQTGLNAAFAVLARIGVGTAPNSPLSQKKDLYDYARSRTAPPGA